MKNMFKNAGKMVLFTCLSLMLLTACVSEVQTQAGYRSCQQTMSHGYGSFRRNIQYYF